MQAASPAAAAATAAGAATAGDGPRARSAARPGRAVAGAGLAGVVISVALICAGAAGGPSPFVPARAGGWPSWLAGPLAPLGLGLSSAGFQALMIAMCVSYALVLAGARSLPARALWAAIIAAHVVVVLGPPLLSQDVFGYLAFARMGALHGLDPYTRVAAEAAGDPLFRFVGWPFLHSPYGPLFTLASYGAVPLGPAGGIWAMKIGSALFSLAGVALVARAARLLGRSAREAAVFVGLSPVLLVMAVGGAHNDTIVMMLLALALSLTAGAARRVGPAGAALAAGIGVKLTAGLALPFLYLGAGRGRERREVALWTGGTLLVVALAGVLGFGSHALGFIGAIGEQQQLIATHSIPAEAARLVGLSGTPAWWKELFAALFAAALAGSLVRTARGADWRDQAGWATLALLLSTSWLLPWYAVWLLPLGALSASRRLRAATLLFSLYAVLIHMSLADPLLSPQAARPAPYRGLTFPGSRHRLELAGFQILRDVQVDLRW